MYNVIFLIADDLNDAIGCYRGMARTPNIDRLAEESLLFTNASTNVSLCHPARGSLLTGLAPWKTGCYNNSQFFRHYEDLKNTVTIPQLFKLNNRVSAGAGKVFHQSAGPLSDQVSWTMQSPFFNREDNGSGWAVEYQAHEYHSQVWGKYFQKALDFGPTKNDKYGCSDYRNANWLSQQFRKIDTIGHFFAYGSLMPHLPWFCPQEFLDWYHLDEIEEPFEEQISHLPPLALNSISHMGYTDLLRYHGVLKEILRAYFACCSFSDFCTGHVLDALRDSKLWDNSIIVLTSDHGWHLGEKNTWSKFKPWERAVRVPFMIRVPGMSTAGQMCDYPVSHLDIYPTICDLLGVDPPHELHGRSLVDCLEGSQPTENRYTLSVASHGSYWSVRDFNYRYIRWVDNHQELYNITFDPGELVNIASENPDICKRMRGAIPTETVESRTNNC